MRALKLKVGTTSIKNHGVTTQAHEGIETIQHPLAFSHPLGNNSSP